MVLIGNNSKKYGICVKLPKIKILKTFSHWDDLSIKPHFHICMWNIIELAMKVFCFVPTQPKPLDSKNPLALHKFYCESYPS